MSLVISNVSTELEKCQIRSALSSCSSQHGNEVRLLADGVRIQKITPLLDRHQLLVLGSHVDPQIVPGFNYRIRKIDDSQMLFQGEAMLLESIGQGYGKRLSFSSNDLLCNENFFWSDSNEYGYAFSLAAMEQGDEFDALDGNGRTIGKAVVKKVNEAQVILRSENRDGCHVKIVETEFACRIDMENGRHIPASSCVVKGIVKMCKSQGKQAQIEEIVIGESNCKVVSLLKPSRKI